MLGSLRLNGVYSSLVKVTVKKNPDIKQIHYEVYMYTPCAVCMCMNKNNHTIQ